MNCLTCKQSINDGAKFCQHCGARVVAAPDASDSTPLPVTYASKNQSAPEKTNVSAKTFGWVLAGFIFIMFLGSLGEEKPAPVEVENDIARLAEANAPKPVIEQKPPEPKSPWSYSQDEDKVRGGTTYYASTTSTNSIAQDFPYDSDTTMDLTVRKSPAYGTDVILTISSGQMMCPSYEGCSGTVSFDGGSPRRISFNGPEDHSNEVVFVEDASSFISRLKKSKRVVIEKTLYEAGNPQFEFDVSGLKWDH